MRAARVSQCVMVSVAVGLSALGQAGKAVQAAGVALGSVVRPVPGEPH